MAYSRKLIFNCYKSIAYEFNLNAIQTSRHSQKCGFMEEFLLCNFIELKLLHGWSPVNLLCFCRTPFLSNIYGGLLLDIYAITRNKETTLYRPMHLFYCPRVSRTTLYALSSHFITCKKLLLQVYFFKYH